MARTDHAPECECGTAPARMVRLDRHVRYARAHRAARLARERTGHAGGLAAGQAALGRGRAAEHARHAGAGSGRAVLHAGGVARVHPALRVGDPAPLALYYSAALSLAGFRSALAIGVLTGTLAFVPYVGYAIGLVLALGAALLQFDGWYGPAMVALIYGLGQVLESFVLTPRLVGERIGLHPLAVIFALLAFGELFGFFSVLVALPSSAVLLVALRRLKQAYFASAFYGRP